MLTKKRAFLRLPIDLFLLKYKMFMVYQFPKDTDRSHGGTKSIFLAILLGILFAKYLFSEIRKAQEIDRIAVNNGFYELKRLFLLYNHKSLLRYQEWYYNSWRTQFTYYQYV